MNIELLDEKRVLIDLCLEDMHMLSMEYTGLSTKSPQSRKIINSLITIARAKTGYSSRRNSVVYVEAMPYDGGCFILITLDVKRKPRKFRIVKKSFKSIFVFNNCENMLCAIEKLHTLKYSDYSSTLMLYKNYYYLILASERPLRLAVTITINEYSGKRCVGRLLLPHILEHGTAIAKKNAVEKIGAALCG